MFVHDKRLQYTVRVAAPDPGLANLLLEQFGGPQGAGHFVRSMESPAGRAVISRENAAGSPPP